MTTPPGADPLLPARLRALSVITDGERRTGAAWWRAMTEFLGLVRSDVHRDGRIEPGVVSDHQQFWSDAVNVRIVPTIATTIRGVMRRVIGRAPDDSDPEVARMLNEAGNRLVRIPDEIYALIVAEVEQGIQAGDDIPTVTQRIDEVLSVSGSERWRNRARTVARTETMAAVNGGALRAAALDAEARGDVAPFKQWLSTDDQRTRPTHVEADMQRTLASEPFVVGGARLMFPGDPQGPAAEVINCRCTVLPIVLGETIDWTDRQFREGT